MENQDYTNQQRVFTYQEACNMIPKVKPIVMDLQKRRDCLIKLEVEIDTLELISGAQEAKDDPALTAAIFRYQSEADEFNHELNRLLQMGCQLKDLDLGLVDFYFVYQGRLVFLCWKLDEATINHWHEVDGGFSSRQPL